MEFLASTKFVCVWQVFQNTISVEAFTREAAMIESLGCDNLTNVKPGDYYGDAATWKLDKKLKLGMVTKKLYIKKNSHLESSLMLLPYPLFWISNQFVEIPHVIIFSLTPSTLHLPPGTFLLFKAFRIFLQEGERQIRPVDLKT